MKKNGLLILTVILCATAAALMAGVTWAQKGGTGSAAQESVTGGQQAPTLAGKDSAESDEKNSDTTEASTVPSEQEGS